MRRENKTFASPDLGRCSTQLGSAIRCARVARNMSRKDFSERANMSASTLVRIERGDVSVNFLAWLQALERSGLLGLLAAVSNPQNDVVGEVRRAAEARKRPRKKQADAANYDF